MSDKGDSRGVESEGLDVVENFADESVSHRIKIGERVALVALRHAVRERVVGKKMCLYVYRVKYGVMRITMGKG